MTDLLDWADVAALKFKRARWFRIWESALQREFAAAIRYGYEQGLLDMARVFSTSNTKPCKDSSNGVTGENVTHPQAVEVAPQSAVESPPVTPEFPRRECSDQLTLIDESDVVKCWLPEGHTGSHSCGDVEWSCDREAKDFGAGGDQ